MSDQDPDDPRTWSDDPAEWTPDVLVAFITRELGAGDMQGVEHGLHILARRDPKRAQDVVDTLRLGLALADMAAR